MPSIPLEGGELQRFTPPSLASLPTPPVFLLRAGTRRDRRTYSARLLDEGLTHHPQHRFRTETLHALEALWDAAAFEQHAPRLRQFWDAVDQHIAANEHREEPAEFAYDPAELEAVNDLIRRCAEAWEPLRRLSRDNLLFSAEAPSVMLSIVLAGWEGVALSYGRADGAVPLDLLEQLEETLAQTERDAAKGDITGVGKPGTAFAELTTEASGRLFLSKADEKN